jgi:glycosyltransferase involved in cell wall biosynthesis
MPAVQARISPTPLVSICVPTYNGTQHLRECLDSALGQTFHDFELVIVDDGSVDETATIAREYAQRDPRVRLYLNGRNLGLVENWNRCVALAQGQWIKFLFQDDYLEPTCLDRMLEACQPGVLLTVCRRTYLFQPETPDHMKRMYERHLSTDSLRQHFADCRVITPEVFAKHMLRYPTTNCIGEPTATLFHRSAFERFGGFLHDIVVLCDWEYAARIAVQTGLSYVDESLATFRVHSKSATQTNFARNRYRVEVLDLVSAHHELAYAPLYEPVRRAASRHQPTVDLRFRLTESAQRARRLARRYARDPLRPDPRAPAEWADAVRRYPRLATIPPGYRAAKVAVALRRARWTVLRQFERAAGFLGVSASVGPS